MNGNSLPIKVFAGLASGLSMSILFCSVLFLFWFVPFNRPGHHIGTVEEITAELKAQPTNAGRSDQELRQAAESVQSFRTWTARVFWKPIEILLVTSTCLFAAYFAALYARAHDLGQGKPGGSLLIPTVLGTVVGAVVLWASASSMIVSDGHAAEHAKAAAQSKAHGAAPDHGHKADAGHAGDDHKHEAASAHAGDWRYDHWNYARLVVFLLGTAVSAIVASLVPRGATSTVATTRLQPAH